MKKYIGMEAGGQEKSSETLIDSISAGFSTDSPPGPFTEDRGSGGILSGPETPMCERPGGSGEGARHAGPAPARRGQSFLIQEHKAPHRCGERLYGKNKCGVDVILDGVDVPVGPEFSKRLNRYTCAVQGARKVGRYWEEWGNALIEMGGGADSPYTWKGDELVRRAWKLKHCGSWMLFRYWYTRDYSALRGGTFCNQVRLCAPCAIRRGGRLLYAVSQKVAQLMEADRSLVAGMVTLTVRNRSDLADVYAHLDQALKRLVKRARMRRTMGRGHVTEWSKVLGFYGSMEFKRGAGSGTWHPHFHAVVLGHELPDQVKLAAEWKEITGDSFIVDVRPLHCMESAATLNGDELIAAVAEDAAEVAKYAVKFSSMEPNDLWRVHQALRRKRLVRQGGSFYGLKVPDRDVTAGMEGEPFIDLVMRESFSA